MWKVEGCVDIFCKKLKKWGLFEKLMKNTQKNEKFEDLFVLVMKICRKIIKVKV